MPIILTNEWNKQAAARAVDGSYWDSDVDAWVLDDDPSPRAAAVALQLFPQLVHENPELLDIRAQLIQDARPVDYATPYWQAAGSPTTGIAPRVEAEMAKRGWAWNQHDGWHQAADLLYGCARLKQDGGFYCGWARGYGKTLFTVGAVDRLGCQATLVVAPNTAKASTWAAELSWAAPWLDVYVLPNFSPDAKDKPGAMNAGQKRERYLAQLRGHARPFVLVAHYEAMALIAGKQAREGKSTVLKDGWKKLGIKWDLKVFDEGHRLSNPDAQQTKAARRIPADMTLMLSGSTFQNAWEELFGQLHVLFPKRYRYVRKDWCDRFLDYVENGYSDVCVGIQPHRVDAMRDELGRFMVLREKKSKTINTTVKVQLTPSQQQAYDELAQTCLTQLEDGTRIKAAAGVSMLTRLRQVASGLDTVGQKVNDSSKIDACIDVVKQYSVERDDDFVVFAWYKSTAYELARRLEAEGIYAHVITGNTPQKERTEIISAFQKGDGRVLIGTIPTMGESINLQRANHVIRLDRSFNPALNLQAVDRVDRQGQTREVYLTDIIAAGTVDEFVVLPTLLNKDAMRACVFGDVNLKAAA